MKRVLAALTGMLLLAYGSVSSAAPIEAYAHLPLVTDMRLSDDGTTVAYVSTQRDAARIAVVQLDGTVLQQVDLGNTKVRVLDWAGPDHVLIYTSTTSGIQDLFMVGEMWQVVSLNIRTGNAVQLINRVHGGMTSYTNVIFGAVVYGHHDGEPMAFAMTYAGGVRSMQEGRIDIVRVDLDTGVAEPHQMGSKDTEGFLIDSSGVAVATTEYDDDHRQWTLRVRDGNGWRTAMTQSAEIERPELEGFSADGNSAILAMWNEDLQVWLYHPVSLATGQVGDAVGPEASTGLVQDHQQRTIGYARTENFTTYSFNDPAQAATWRRVVDTFPNREINLINATPDFAKLLVYVEGTGYAGNYFVFDTATGRMRQIARAYPDIPSADIAEVRAITYKAADGLDIPAYLTLPVGRDPTSLPLVVLPHGGPQSRDWARFDWIAQGIASRGYAVLQPNFRGSSGYGGRFVDAGHGEWGRKMQTDLSDGVAYLAGRGIVDPQRVCIVGASYGGYAALAGVTLQHGIYRCAVDMEGISDIPAFLSWRVGRSGERSSSVRYWARFLGVDRYDDPSLRGLSPINAIGGDAAPILIIHGRDDTVVPFAQSSSMLRALQNAHRPVEMVELQQEDHWLSRDATRLQALRATVAFLEQHNPPGAAPPH
ncbi:MAG TPA: alpha/beta fold hydrolase [Caulobacterales bacterium]|nr:alpha/beta fold hydrolase [Caulobacterales bacterium]